MEWKDRQEGRNGSIKNGTNTKVVQAPMTRGGNDYRVSGNRNDGRGKPRRLTKARLPSSTRWRATEHRDAAMSAWSPKDAFERPQDRPDETQSARFAVAAPAEASPAATGT